MYWQNFVNVNCMQSVVAIGIRRCSRQSYPSVGTQPTPLSRT